MNALTSLNSFKSYNVNKELNPNLEVTISAEMVKDLPKVNLVEAQPFNKPHSNDYASIYDLTLNYKSDLGPISLNPYVRIKEHHPKPSSELSLSSSSSLMYFSALSISCW